MIDPDLVCRRVTRPPSVAGYFSQSGTDYRSPMRNFNIAERPSEAPFPASRGSVTGNSKHKTTPCRNFWYTGRCRYGDRCKFSHLPEKTCRYNSRRMCPYGERCIFYHRESDYYVARREDLYTKNTVNNIQPVDVDSRSNRRQCTNLMIVDICTYGSVCNYALGQEGSRRSAPVLAPESGNAQAAPKTLVKDAFPSEVQKLLKPTASKHKLPPQVSSFKWTRPMKIVGIYADWIDEESSVPGLACRHQQ